jgi:nucleotide-binding universal stress UspA family protein
VYKNILVAYDGSKLGKKALDTSIQIAKQNDAKLTIVTAVEPLPPMGTPEVPAYMSQYSEDLEKNFKALHYKIMKQINEEHPKMKVKSRIVSGKAATVIKEESKDKDLIVIGHRGHGIIMSWVLGSVAKTVVDTCTVPVLIVKTLDQEPE